MNQKAYQKHSRTKFMVIKKNGYAKLRKVIPERRLQLFFFQISTLIKKKKQKY